MAEGGSVTAAAEPETDGELAAPTTGVDANKGDDTGAEALTVCKGCEIGMGGESGGDVELIALTAEDWGSCEVEKAGGEKVAIALCPSGMAMLLRFEVMDGGISM